MKQLISLLVAAMFAAVSVAAVAQDKDKKSADKMGKMEKSTTTKDAPKKQQTAAQKKRQECNEQATERKLKGDERKKFVSSCAKPAAKKSADTGAKSTKDNEKKK